MNAVIWIDRQNAKLFFLSNMKMERKALHAGQPNHHTHAHDRFDESRQEHQLFRDAASELREVDAMLILGPGVAKHHFQTFLTEHYPALARKILAVETVDHPSDGQIAALAKRFFDAREKAATGA